MAQYLIDADQTRDIGLLYCASSPDEFAFKDLFAQAAGSGLAASYIDTSMTPIGPNVISSALPDYKDRLFYISGPYGFVKTVRQSLINLGVGPASIKTDYFPGYGG